MEDQYFQYSAAEFDAESLILYDPESSLSDEEMGLRTQEFQQDPEVDEFDAESLISYDPESTQADEETELLVQEFRQDQDPEEMCDEFDADSVILYNSEESNSSIVMYDSVPSQADSVSDGLQGSIAVVSTVDTDDTLDERMDENECEESDTIHDNVFKGRTRPGRKRKVLTQTRADRKRLLNNNKTHVNSKRKVYEEKIFDEHFECRCLHNCTNVVPLASRQRCFSQFWTSGSFEARVLFLITCLSRTPAHWMNEVKESKEEIVSRNNRDIYGMPVCQKAILGTLQIDESRFATAIEKYTKADTLKDNRGKSSGGWNALPQSVTEEVRKHIASFPKYVSHYTRGKTESKFLSSDLNLSKLYELYKEKIEKPASRSFYKNIFYNNFDLKFKPPKKDTCLKCDSHANKRKTLFGAKLQEEDQKHEAHLMRAESLQAQLKADCTAARMDNELETLTFDMQKTLPIPKLCTSIAYYKRQLNLYNLGIHSGSDGKGCFNLWIESEASKGTQEISSLLSNKNENTINLISPIFSFY